MDDLINQLKTFAVEDFPIGKVSEYLNNYSISNKNLDDYVHFKDEKYCRNLIYKEDDFEILLVCWKAGQVAPIHGHEGEKCWMRVESGALRVSNYLLQSLDPLTLNIFLSSEDEIVIVFLSNCAAFICEDKDLFHIKL